MCEFAVSSQNFDYDVRCLSEFPKIVAAAKKYLTVYFCTIVQAEWSLATGGLRDSYFYLMYVKLATKRQWCATDAYIFRHHHLYGYITVAFRVYSNIQSQTVNALWNL